MLRLVVLAIPLAILWVLLTSITTIESFIIGYVLSFGILILARGHTGELQLLRLPIQLGALLVYVLRLARDIMLSSIDVARRVLAREMPLNPGIVAVPTHSDDEVIAALSAHAITITPGSLAVDFEENEIIFVHTLDVETIGENLEADQRKRLGLLRRMLGHG
ncbi:MAG: Na+/H+ antiporter subunit E [Chloroflexi bacterium]|nr:Na+/H+ antiporter subunit E [Chloroflexota bacterium]